MEEEALNELRSDPQSFLRHYVVFIAGGPMPIGMQYTQFIMEEAVGQTYQGFQTGISGLKGETKERPKLRIRMARGGLAGGVVFEAWYVPMSGDDTGNGREVHHVLLPGQGGPDIALTSQLSGCTFSIGSSSGGGGRVVSHIRPPGGPQPDAATYRAMRQEANSGRMAAVFDRLSRPGAHSYGNPQNYATIFGIRRRGNWRFYAQTYNLGDRRLFKVEALNR